MHNYTEYVPVIVSAAASSPPVEARYLEADVSRIFGLLLASPAPGPGVLVDLPRVVVRDVPQPPPPRVQLPVAALLLPHLTLTVNSLSFSI